MRRIQKTMENRNIRRLGQCTQKKKNSVQRICSVAGVGAKPLLTKNKSFKPNPHTYGVLRHISVCRQTRHEKRQASSHTWLPNFTPIGVMRDSITQRVSERNTKASAFWVMCDSFTQRGVCHECANSPWSDASSCGIFVSWWSSSVSLTPSG